MEAITQSVGKNGINKVSDVKVVQRALNSHHQEPALLTVDGLSGPRTVAAIEEFQARVLGFKHPDGRVDPGGKTFQALAHTVSPNGPEDWSGDSSKWPEDKKLSSMNSQLRSKVIPLLETLRSQGHEPKVFFAWRSLAAQAELKKQGRTTVDFSFHNASRAGRPNAYAADIIDRRFGWSEGSEAKAFFNALGKQAKFLDLHWGGDWVTFRDFAHIQLFPNSKLADIKAASTEASP